MILYTRFHRLRTIFLICGLFIGIGLITTQNVQATPPSKIDLTYDFAKLTLTITITHNTGDVYAHTVFFIEVHKNDVYVADLSLDSQPTASSFSVSKKISAVNNDRFNVIAFCKEYGVSSGELIVLDTVPSNNSPQKIDGYSLNIIFLTTIIIMIIQAKKSNIFKHK